jgi:hypothetical protein
MDCSEAAITRVSSGAFPWRRSLNPVVDLHPQSLDDLRVDINLEEAVGKATAQNGVDEVGVDRTERMKLQVLCQFAWEML